MHRLPFICGLGILVSATAWADPPNEQATPDAVTIPLDKIWGYKLPGTRDLLELEPEQRPKALARLPLDRQRELLAKRLWHPIVLALCSDTSTDWPKEGEIARTGFVVVGSGRAALEQVYDVLVRGEKPSAAFSSQTELSAVFFSYQSGAYVELRSVARRGNRISIEYRFIYPRSMVQAAHLALIPLGKLPAGHYEVDVVQLASGQQISEEGYGPRGSRKPDRPVQDNWGRRLVSGDFSFEVSDDKK